MTKSRNLNCSYLYETSNDYYSVRLCKTLIRTHSAAQLPLSNKFTMHRGCSTMAKALDLQSRGWWFESGSWSISHFFPFLVVYFKLYHVILFIFNSYNLAERIDGSTGLNVGLLFELYLFSN